MVGLSAGWGGAPFLPPDLGKEGLTERVEQVSLCFG